MWEVCDVITKQTGFDYSTTIKPSLVKEKSDNTYPFIQNKDFNGTHINMNTDFFVPINIAEKFPKIVLDRPSILISISGRIGNVGICKLKDIDDGIFIVQELESEYGQKYFHLLIKASSHANITVEDIRNIELFFPNKKVEKIHISILLSKIDHLITLHQSKSFKCFFVDVACCTLSWEQRKLSSLCDKFTDGDWIEAKDQSNSGVRLIQTGNVGVAEYLDKPNNKKWISNDTFEALNCEEVFEGDILISRLPEPAGRACIIPKLASKIITAVDCTIVRVSNDTSNKYLLQYLSSQK